MLNIATKLKRSILLLGDVMVLYFSLWLTLVIRFQEPVNQEVWDKHWLPFTIVFVMWVVIFYIHKLYELAAAQNNFKFVTTALNSLVWCALVGFIFFYIATTGISPKTILVIDVIIFGLLFIVWRRIFNKLIASGKFLENVVIVGLTNETISLTREVNARPQMGLRVRAIVELQENQLALKDDKIQVISDVHNLKDFLAKNKVKTIIMATDTRNYPELIEELYESLHLQVNILDLPAFAEKFTNRILVNTIGQMWFLENIKEADKQIYEAVKRLLDILLSVVLLIISLPCLPLIYLTIRMSSKGPGFFMQQRTGKNGKKFMAVKFRTMYADAETRGPQWAQRNDPRVTGVGRFLRKSRIDEIPQLINILRGEMSFIGPRPERPEFIKTLKEKIPFYETRLLIKPGLTGWAQINFPYGASEEDALEKLQYDLYYIKNRSFVLDGSILLKTIKTVLSGGGQ